MKFSLQEARLSNVWMLMLVFATIFMISAVRAAEIPSAPRETTVRNVREAAVGNEMELGAELDDATAEGLEADLLNYLFNKQIMRRLRQQLPIAELQRKRSYWKQCAFNAVSCFGK